MCLLVKILLMNASRPVEMTVAVQNARLRLGGQGRKQWSQHPTHTVVELWRGGQPREQRERPGQLVQQT